MRWTPIWGNLGPWRAAATEAGWSRGSPEPPPSRCLRLNPVRLLPTVPTKPLVFAPETPVPPLLVLTLLPSPDGSCFPGARGHGPRSSHRPLAMQAGAESHMSLPALAPIWAPSPNPFLQPLNGVLRQILPRQPERGGSSSHKLVSMTSLGAGSPTRVGLPHSARCVRVKSGHEAVTIVQDP